MSLLLGFASLSDELANHILLNDLSLQTDAAKVVQFGHLLLLLKLALYGVEISAALTHH